MFVRVFPVKRCNLAYGLNALRAGVRADIDDILFSFYAIARADAHFDEFMVLEGEIDLGKNRICHSRLADHNDGF